MTTITPSEIKLNSKGNKAFKVEIHYIHKYRLHRVQEGVVSQYNRWSTSYSSYMTRPCHFITKVRLVKSGGKQLYHLMYCITSDTVRTSLTRARNPRVFLSSRNAALKSTSFIRIKSLTCLVSSSNKYSGKAKQADMLFFQAVLLFCWVALGVRVMNSQCFSPPTYLWGLPCYSCLPSTALKGVLRKP